MWIVTRESVVALEDMQLLVSGQAFLLQDLFQSQTHFGLNILESTTRCIRRDPSNCCYCLVVSELGWSERDTECLLQLSICQNV